MDMITPEASLESVKKYFTETFNFAEDVKYEIGDEEIVLTVQNCVLRPITDHFEAQGIPRLPQPYANSATIALEKATGDMHIYQKGESPSNTLCNLHLKKFDL